MFQKSAMGTIKEYVSYQRTLRDVHIGHELPAEVKFAVNVDIGGWPEMMAELERRVPPSLLCKGERDVLGLLRQEVEGITVPQIYLKVVGCWTGGHEENLRIRAVNINTGGGDVEWYCMDVKETSKLRALVKNRYNIDIYSTEGLWYTDLYFCLSQNLRIIKFIQEPGDCVVLKPGTLHWVRSLTVTTNVAWNIALNDIGEIEQIYERFSENVKIGFKNIFPVQTLFLDLLNCYADRLDITTLEYVKSKLVGWVESEYAMFASFKNKYPDRNFEIDDVNKNNVLLCSFCNRDTLLFWATCYDEKQYDIYCLFCFDSHLRKQHKCSKGHDCYQKYNKKDVQALLSFDFCSAECFTCPLVRSLAAPAFYTNRKLVTGYAFASSSADALADGDGKRARNPPKGKMMIAEAKDNKPKHHSPKHKHRIRKDLSLESNGSEHEFRQKRRVEPTNDIDTCELKKREQPDPEPKTPPSERNTHQPPQAQTQQ